MQRWYDNLVYGRRGDAGEGEGIALHKVWRSSIFVFSYRLKVVNENTKKNLFAIITYGYPMLSARAVPMLQDFCKKFVTKLQ